jgi:hypothetical protein
MKQFTSGKNLLVSARKVTSTVINLERGLWIVDLNILCSSN